VSDQRLLRRKNGVYYYRRRVPLDLVEKFGKEIVQLSLHTTSRKQAKKQRTLRDLEWDARFEAARATKPADAVNKQPQPAAPGGPLDESACLELVRAYVERHDGAARKREAQWYPITVEERREMQIDAEVEAQSLCARDDLHHQWVHQAGTEALKAAGESFGDPDVPGEIVAELVRRGLMELNRRYRSRLADDHSRSFFDQLFDPSRPAEVTFGKLADQHLQIIVEDGSINAHSVKGLDRQRATIGLIREIVGDKTPVHAVDYDTCLQVRASSRGCRPTGRSSMAIFPSSRRSSALPRRANPCLPPSPRSDTSPLYGTSSIWPRKSG
jgi:hypothetical protein